MLKITDAAIKQITKEVQDIINEGKKPFIRLAMGIGWGGPQLRLALEESALDSDEIIEQGEIQFLVDERSKVYFNSAKIDFTKSLFGGGQFIVLKV
jgi:Fe-S cluster assembly iron-binding protein IscA